MNWNKAEKRTQKTFFWMLNCLSLNETLDLKQFIFIHSNTQLHKAQQRTRFSPSKYFVATRIDFNYCRKCGGRQHNVFLSYFLSFNFSEGYPQIYILFLLCVFFRIHIMLQLKLKYINSMYDYGKKIKNFLQ